MTVAQDTDPVVLLGGRSCDHRDLRIRLWGAAIAFALGLATLLPGASGSPTFPDGWTSALVLILGPILGASFAVRASEPGMASAFGAAAAITAIAVPTGAVLVGLGLGVVAGVAPTELVMGGIVVGLFGMLFLGIPMAMPTFVVASIWVGILRVIVRSDPTP